MYSLNVPVPGEVKRVAMDLRAALADFEQFRDELSMVAKRLPIDDPAAFPAIHERTLSVLRGTVPFEVRVNGIEVFEEPTTGPAPVIYFAVESPGLARLHDRLVEEFDPVPEIEDEAYVPHITLARGGSVSQERLEELRSLEVEPIPWTVDRLVIWDPRRQLPAGEVRLPA